MGNLSKEKGTYQILIGVFIRCEKGILESRRGSLKKREYGHLFKGK